MLRFWGQPKFWLPKGVMIGFELFLREQASPDGKWRVPRDFSAYPPAMVVDMLRKTLASFSRGVRLVSVNLDQEQFVDPAFCRLLAELALSQQLELVVELTERRGCGPRTVTLPALQQAAMRMQACGLAVCLDDVGTGENQAALVDALSPYVSEYKYALQNVRGQADAQAIQADVKRWRERADAENKKFAMEGFESAADVAWIDAFAPNIVQGYYFSRPLSLPMCTDFHHQ